jgi:Transposase, Mutator family
MEGSSPAGSGSHRFIARVVQRRTDRASELPARCGYWLGWKLLDHLVGEQPLDVALHWPLAEALTQLRQHSVDRLPTKRRSVVRRTLVDLKNRGVRDLFFLVCDGLKGLPDVVEAVWPQAIVQTCIIHLIRNTFRLTSRADSDAIKRDIKPIYTAANADAALAGTVNRLFTIEGVVAV